MVSADYADHVEHVDHADHAGATLESERAVCYRCNMEIRGFHAHVYFDPATRGVAANVREELAARFTVELGRWHDVPVGPHPKSMYQVAFAAGEFAGIVPWLMLNRGGLGIFVHPITGDEVADHTSHALWLGEQLPLNIDFLRQFAKPSE
jgi:DOPA 4,5-dioxygenase